MVLGKHLRLTQKFLFYRYFDGTVPLHKSKPICVQAQPHTITNTNNLY